MSQDLREMVYHTDARVTAMESQLTGLGHSMDRIEANLMNKPPFNAAPWVGIGLTIIMGITGMGFTALNYISLTQEPLEDVVRTLASKQALIEDFRTQSHFEIGTTKAEQKYHQLEIEKLWAHIHKQEDIDREHDQELAAAKVSRKAMGDYLKEHNQQSKHVE